MKIQIEGEFPDFGSLDRVFWIEAMEMWSQGDIEGILLMLPHQKRGEFMFSNIGALRAAGFYEEALLISFTHGPMLPPSDWQFMFRFADRSRLRGLGDRLPDAATRLYRGVVDCRKRRWIRGLSWTPDPHIAAWFATRRPNNGVPAVYSVVAPQESLLCFTNARSEQEVILAIWECGRLRRLPIIPDPVKPGNV